MILKSSHCAFKAVVSQVWAFTQRSLYERHKQLFTLMMAMKIDLQKKHITHEEFMVFIKGGASLDLNAVAPKPFRWILDITWLNLVEISKLNTFSDILTKVRCFLTTHCTYFDKNFIFTRLNRVKRNGKCGTKRKNRKKKKYHVAIRRS